MKIGGWFLFLLVASVFVVAFSNVDSNDFTNKCGGGLKTESLDSCGPAKDLILVYEESSNTRKAWSSLRRGAARLLRAASGRCENAYRVHTKRFLSNGAIENTSISTDVNEVLDTIRFVENHPLDATQQCPFECCCSDSFFKYLSKLIDEFPNGATLFALIECFSLDTDLLYALQSKLRTWRVVLLKLNNSYCKSNGAKLENLGLADTVFFVNSEFVGNVFESIQMFYRAKLSSAVAAGACHNAKVGLTVLPSTHGIGMVLNSGKLLSPPVIIDPNNRTWAGERTVFVNDTDIAIVAMYPTTCGKGWVAVRGRCYFVQGRATFEKASDSCRRLGATLTTVFDGSDVDILDHAEIRQQLMETETELDDARLNPSSIWLALHDTGKSGDWEWQLLRGFASVSLVAVDFIFQLVNINYTNWARNEPSNMIPSRKRCAALDLQTGRWRVSLCQVLLVSVCERPQDMFDFVGVDDQPTYMQTGEWKAIIDSYSLCNTNYYLLR